MATHGKVIASDGAALFYNIYNPSGSKTVVLIHGWSGSSKYFTLNAREIASKGLRVITYDQRFHGESGRTAWGHSIARLAADLWTLLQKLDVRNACCVGTSMGCAVIWSYVELFGETDRIGKIVTVDQAPLQDIRSDWRLGSTGCYDIASLTRLQCAIMHDFRKFAEDNGKFCCDSGKLDPQLVKLLENETLKADKEALCKLMSDHTARDWRPTLAAIRVPCLNIVGKLSRVFPWEGVDAVSKLLTASPRVQTEYFDFNHWLYLEDPDRFNCLIADFALGS